MWFCKVCTDPWLLFCSWPISSHLDRTNLVNNAYIPVWLFRTMYTRAGEAPVSGLPQEAEKLSVTGVAVYRNV